MRKSTQIKEPCSRCPSQNLQTEVELLRQKVVDKNIAIVQMETKMAQELPHIYSQSQLASLRATCDSWQDKYERMLEAHKRLQRVNQGLEDKLLRLVDRSESEKAKLTQDASKLTTALTTAAQAINRLKNENTRYQNDLSLAIQLLQCNSSQYTSHKLDMLPLDLQHKIKSQMIPEVSKPPPKTEAKIIRVPIPTFPPTAMVYSVNKDFEDKSEKEEPVDVVSAAILAAILEEREKERSKKHCPTCTCKQSPDSKNSPSKLSSLNPEEHIHEERFSSGSVVGVNAIDVGTQTIASYIGETGKVRSTCIYCHSNKGRGLDCDESPTSSSSSHKKVGKRHPWDWQAESQDSGSPPTPTSLTSTSLSYESETSCFTSPQESPGHGVPSKNPSPLIEHVKHSDWKRTSYSPPKGLLNKPMVGISPPGRKLMFSSFSPDQDAFAIPTPIHASPPSRRAKELSPPLSPQTETQDVNFSQSFYSDTMKSIDCIIKGAISEEKQPILPVVLSSMHTFSATETCL